MNSRAIPISAWARANLERYGRETGTVVALLLPIPTGLGPLRFGQVVVALLFPFIFPAVWRLAGLRVLLVTLLAALLSVPLLLRLSLSDPGRSLDMKAGTLLVAELVCAGLTVVGATWAISRTGVQESLLLIAGGGTVVAVLNTAAWGDDPWKYAFAWPASLLVIAATVRLRNRWRILALLTITTLAMSQSSRNNAGALALTAIVSAAFGGAWAPRWNRISRKAFVIAGAGAMAAVVLGLLVVNTVYENSHPGRNFLLASRPEAAATFALFLAQPLGYGPGLVPAHHDIQTALDGLTSIGAPTNSDYVQHYMLGGRLEVHSVFGDLWLAFGVAGFLVALVALAILARGLGIAVVQRSAFLPLVAFASLQAMWDLLFSPTSSLFWVSVATGLALAPQIRCRSQEIDPFWNSARLSVIRQTDQSHPGRAGQPT